MSRIFDKSTDLPFLVECTVFTTQDVNGKISVKVNDPYRLHWTTCKLYNISIFQGTIAR